MPALKCFSIVILFLASHSVNVLADGTALADQRRFNIVILYADDMGYGDLAVQNPQSKIPTPHLDRLAAQGMRFTDAHSSSGICTPSRYALLTGHFHWRKFHGIVNAFGKPVFDDDELTSDFDWDKPISGGPLSHGFDQYFGDDVPNFPPYAWFRDDRVITRPTEPLEITPQTKEGSWEARPGPMTPGWDFYAVVPRLKDETVQWIGQERAKEGPFILYVPFNSPHAPIVPTAAFTGASAAGGFGDFMAQTDDKVGQILKAIEDNGFGDNTLVLFTSDNGAERYAYDRIRNHGHRSSAMLRGLKRDLYEGGHRGCRVS